MIVDGYNIINAWPELVELVKDNLENARHKLLEIMANYQGYIKAKVIVVFDAHLVKGSTQKREKYGGLEVVFTKENETADNYIERLTHQIAKSNRVRVATSDFLEQTIILGKGATRISAQELHQEVQQVRKRIQEKSLEKTVKSHTIGSRLQKDTLEALEKLRREKF